MKFKVSGYVNVSCWTAVDADSEEDALKIAKNRELAYFSIDGTSQIDECFHIENDGTPSNLTVE